MTADHVRTGLAIDEHPRAAVVKHHVAAIPLPPAHDVAGEESPALGLRDRERFGGLAGLRDVPLRVEAERRQGAVDMIILEAQQRTEKRAERHPHLRFGGAIDGDLNRQILDLLFAEHKPHVPDAACARDVEDLDWLVRQQIHVRRGASRAEVRRQLQQRHRRIGVGRRESISLLRVGGECRETGDPNDEGPEVSQLISSHKLF